MRRRSTVTAGCAVVVLVVAQLASHAHEAAARHVTCEEHGERLEAAVVAAHPDDGVARWVAVEGAGGDHEECLIASALRQSGLAPAHAQLQLDVATVDVAIAPQHRTEGATVAIYRLAPKTSPPVAG